MSDLLRAVAEIARLRERVDDLNAIDTGAWQREKLTEMQNRAADELQRAEADIDFAAIHAELVRLREVEARYSWLRQRIVPTELQGNDSVAWQIPLGKRQTVAEPNDPDHELIDAAIDRARKQEEGK